MRVVLTWKIAIPHVFIEFAELQKSLLSEFALLLKKLWGQVTVEITCKVSPEHKEITFDESGALLFSENALKF